MPVPVPLSDPPPGAGLRRRIADLLVSQTMGVLTT